MAMKLFRIILACLAVLFLGSCGVLQFIFGSVFPSTLSLAKARADLSGLIPADNTGSTYIRLVETTGGYSYVVVTGSTIATGNFAFFYDLDLNLKLSLTGASAPAGTGVMFEAGGQIAIGNTVLNAADFTLLLTMPGGTVVYAQGHSGVDGFASGQNVANIFCPGGSNTLSYTLYTGTWSTPSPLSATLSASMSNLRVNAVFDDGTSPGNIILVVSQSGSSNGNTATCYFVTMPKSYFIAGIPNYLLDSAPHRDNLEIESLGFANGSVFAYDNSSSSYVRINPADASIQNSFYSGSKTQQPLFSYRVSGGSFYGFDKKSRILTKYTAWW